MKSRTFIFLSLLLPLFISASSKPGDGNKDKDKGHKVCKKEAKAEHIEDFVFMLPAPVNTYARCMEKKNLHLTVINFYKWYLQNQDRIAAALSRGNSGTDLIPPFNISWETLHEYFEVIQKKYPDWITQITPVATGAPAVMSATGKAPQGAGSAGGESGTSTLNFSNLAK
jgi:hypothetical protein